MSDRRHPEPKPPRATHVKRADAQHNYDQVLAVARTVIAEAGADASLRDIARRAGVGLGTLYRHFPTREALLEALLGAEWDALAAKARALETARKPDQALVAWLRDFIAGARTFRGVVAAMAAALADKSSALHASCVAMRAAGTRLLARAQAEGSARADLDGMDVFAIVAALAWIGDHTALEPRAAHLFDVVMDAVFTRKRA